MLVVLGTSEEKLRILILSKRVGNLREAEIIVSVIQRTGNGFVMII